MMKLTIFDATGATGRQLLKQSLDAGNHVVAYARNPSKIDASHERLAIVQGELADTAAIEDAVGGPYAVNSVLGPRPQEDLISKPLTQGMQNILAAILKTNVRRLIISSTPSASDPNDLSDFKFKVLVAIIKTVIHPAYEEIVNVAQLVRESNTDWTIVRVSMLNNNPASGKIKTDYLGHKLVGTKISRADLAAFMLMQEQDTTYLRQAPAISN